MAPPACLCVLMVLPMAGAARNLAEPRAACGCRFGPLGWNIPYEFLGGDLSCGLQTLAMFLREQREEGPPWAALQYVIGQINYGGRVTDDNDRRLLACILQQCLGPSTLEEGFAFDATRESAQRCCLCVLAAPACVTVLHRAVREHRCSTAVVCCYSYI
jgi:hypothetical protein